MVQRLVELPNINMVYDFHKRINKVNCDIDFMSTNLHYVVDAKSLMGIMSMDLTVPVLLRAMTDDPKTIEQIDEIIKITGIGRVRK